ncbi:RNA polymerase sigma factor [Thermobacillus xylanilyticus]|uniref:RNA polymerase sigma factor n=1 Tax=Thermobacillus xylanilyticus TaxID=76633 RepID=A0ABM8V295_THEXY|nr:sigma-70 family RNA polymerase sigma factor [Thermobacillus xylanilyticus]CAG5082690.1 RNA polymerase sigma factor [Thermobacillus xylanilyticus]
MIELAFALRMVEDLKPELTSYCYRMLGSMDDADDAVQETSIRVWQRWDTFRGESSFKTWVYRIATNLCLDKLRQAKRRVLPVDVYDPAVTIAEPRDTLPETSWVWPAPEFADQPEETAIRRDTLQLCFIALLQTLPPRQRAVLILKDVFEWSAKEIADALDMSAAAVNSALQRARGTMEQAQLRSHSFSAESSAPDRELLSRYMEAFERFDIDALVSLFHEEGSMSMPPFTMWVQGRDHLSRFFALTRHHCEGSRFIPITVNGGYPALAQYVPDPESSSRVPWGIHVIEMKDGKILHIQNFINRNLFARFGLPDPLDR